MHILPVRPSTMVATQLMLFCCSTGVDADYNFHEIVLWCIALHALAFSFIHFALEYLSLGNLIA